MKPAVCLALWLAVAPLAHAALEFSGYIKSGPQHQFVVTDLETGEGSGFIRLGSTFRGHRLRSFEPDREVLVVERDGKTVRLPLKDSRVQQGSPVAAPGRTELKVEVRPDGTVVVNGTPTTREEFVASLRPHADRATPLAVFFHPPLDPGPKVHETITALTQAVGKSGVKKWSIKVVDARPPPAK